jgi:hypothetical protein
MIKQETSKSDSDSVICSLKKVGATYTHATTTFQKLSLQSFLEKEKTIKQSMRIQNWIPGVKDESVWLDKTKEYFASCKKMDEDETIRRRKMTIMGHLLQHDNYTINRDNRDNTTERTKITDELYMSCRVIGASLSFTEIFLIIWILPALSVVQTIKPAYSEKRKKGSQHTVPSHSYTQSTCVTPNAKKNIYSFWLHEYCKLKCVFCV